MNLQKFNRGILPEKDFEMREGKELVAKMPSNVIDSPIFIWDDLEDEKLLSHDLTDILDKIDYESNVLPFDTLRLYIRANSSDRKAGMRGIRAWIHHDTDIGRLYVAFSAEEDILNKALGGEMFHSIHTAKNRKAPNMVALKTQSRLDDRLLDYATFPRPFLGAFNESSVATFTSISWFIREAAAPTTFLATVEPNQAGRRNSVYWKKANTHYVLISKDHPANQKTVVSGQNVIATKDQIQRIAHSRRAHTRVLRSPIFKNNVGKTIRIRAAWVGPTEWKEHKSIYKMVGKPSENERVEGVAKEEKVCA